jgi:hypothetical protein
LRDSYSPVIAMLTSSHASKNMSYIGAQNF